MHDGSSTVSPGAAPAASLAVECARRMAEELPRLVRFLRQRIDAASPPDGLTTGQYFVLALVRDGVTSPGELAMRFAVSSPTVTGLIARLSAKGLIGRTPNDHDRRTVRLSVTPAGADALARMEAFMAERMAGLVVDLSEAQQRETIAAMDSIHALLGAADEQAMERYAALPGSSGTKIAAPR